MGLTQRPAFIRQRAAASPMTPAELASMLASLALAGMSAVVSAAYLLQKIVSSAVSRVLRAPLAESSPLDRVYTASWVLAAAAGAWISRGSGLPAMIATALAFKSGSDLGSRLVYSIHDLSLLSRGGGLRSAVSKALALTSVPSLLFLLTWWLTLQATSVFVTRVLGLPLNLVSLGLWVAGISFGLAFGALRSRGEEGVLLRGELALVLGSAARAALTSERER